MLGQDRALELVEAALRVDGADEVEATLTAGDSGLTRFADSIIHQHSERSDAVLRVRVITQQRSAAASTNLLDPDAVREAGRRALEMARLSPPDDGFPGLPGDGGRSLVSRELAARRWDEATAAASPAERAGRVAEVVAAAGERPAAGFFATSRGEVAFANSNAIRRYSRATSASFTAMVRSGTGSAHHECDAARADAIPVRELAEGLAEWADRGQDPGAIEPGTYPVVLLPLAVGEMLEYLNWMGFGAKDLLNGESFFLDRAGDRVAAPGVSVIDDVAHPVTLGTAFDWEGVWRTRVALIEDGIARSPVYDTRTAAEAGTATTGHASGSQQYGPFPSNLVIPPGPLAEEDLIAGIDRGLLVRRFWYVNVVNQRETTLTGMTRDGLFLIEGGKVARPVHNLRFTQSVLGALAGCSGVGDTPVCLSGGSVVVPALRLDAFTFTSATTH